VEIIITFKIFTVLIVIFAVVAAFIVVDVCIINCFKFLG